MTDRERRSGKSIDEMAAERDRIREMRQDRARKMNEKVAQASGGDV